MIHLCNQCKPKQTYVLSFFHSFLHLEVISATPPGITAFVSSQYYLSSSVAVAIILGTMGIISVCLFYCSIDDGLEQ